MGCSHVTNCTVLPSLVAFSGLDSKNVRNLRSNLCLFSVGPHDWLLKSLLPGNFSLHCMEYMITWRWLTKARFQIHPKSSHDSSSDYLA